MARDIPKSYSTPAILSILAGLTALLAFFVPTHWRTWIHWSWPGILWHFISIGLWVFFVWVFSFEDAKSMMKDSKGDRIERSRRASYGLCAMAVLCAAVVIGLMVSSGASAGDYIEATGETVSEDVPPWPIYKRDRLIKDIFLVTLIPALVGVRSALGPKTKKD